MLAVWFHVSMQWIAIIILFIVFKEIADKIKGSEK